MGKRLSVLCSTLLSLSFMVASCSSERQVAVVQAVAPDYPRVGQLAHIAGEVTVEADVLPSGKVSNAEIVSGLALGEIRRAAVDAAKEWIFNKSSEKSRKEVLTFEFRIAQADNQQTSDTHEKRVEFFPPNKVRVTVNSVILIDPSATVRRKRK
ncbi:MAG TPA: TonB family protein [Candidatus Acidoferrales bacterium]|nr:TonB family protein [Candidatus Acidoferrales bacterium]